MSEKSKEFLELENIELKQLLKSIIMHGDSYKEWMRNYGTNQMTTQKQSYNNLIESIRRGEKFLKELE